ncbi:DUF1566 domain-containing protein [Halioglobus maricola]|uniref:DUF1566 domain-containing protein n=1 Tax=Halioglobus maricola TaxID=2601894 RepID=A0A5P9NKV4_9GAMM|nr:DUF1566 domain-containing protein [Halioglobus maricola]QFU76239.1 DUF1566 domain-containing protein [Halioglobus maricola]
MLNGSKIAAACRLFCIALLLTCTACGSGGSSSSDGNPFSDDQSDSTSGSNDGATNDDDTGDGEASGDGDAPDYIEPEVFSNGMAALNDTGIDFGSNSNTNGSDCSLSLMASDGVTPLAQDCAQGRDAEASSDNDGINGFDFTRLNANGSKYTGSGEFETDPWACVRDNRTGLLWEVKTRDGSIHDADNTYRWGGLTALDRGSVDRTGDYYDDWNELVIGTNAKELCGYSDWRVPTNAQMMSIIHFGLESRPFKVDTDYFPNAIGDFYWTSAPYRGSHGEFYAWAFQLVFGNNKNLQRYQASAVRLVRVIDPFSGSGGAEETPDERYTIDENGTVTDVATGLMWAQCVAGLEGALCNSGDARSMDWGTALEYAQNSTLAGHSDWRLPNTKELFSLINFNAAEPAINLNIFPATTVDYTWTSSPMIEFSQDSWFINFKTGLNWFKGRDDTMLVRLVREGTDNLATTDIDTQEIAAVTSDDGLGTMAGSMEPVDIHAQLLANEQGFTGDPTTGRDLPHINDPKAQLGKALFYSKRLSGEYDTACASCHHPMLGGGDNLSWPVGYDAVNIFHNSAPDLVGPGRYFDGSDPDELEGYPVIGRNAPSLFNVGLLDNSLFWDGRIESMNGAPGARGTSAGIITPDSPDSSTPDSNVPEGASLANAQSRFPTVTHEEMRGDEPLGGGNQSYRDMLAQRFVGIQEWEALFQSAYGTTEITFDRIAEALAAFEESMVFTENPWKEYVAFLLGDPSRDSNALTHDQKVGAVLFMTEGDEGGAACSECHSGDAFTDGQYHAIGLGQVGPGHGNDNLFVTDSDFGRQNISGDTGDAYHFRTSPLLNIAVTGPYMHNGALSNLRQVMDVYGNPGGAMNELLGLGTILNANATFNETGDADYCELQSVINIMAKTDENCEEVYYNMNPFAFENTRFLFRQSFDDSVSNSPAPEIDINIQQSDRVVRFMEALTDPCVTDRACLQPWIYDSSNWTEHPDYSENRNFILIAEDRDGMEL